MAEFNFKAFVESSEDCIKIFSNGRFVYVNSAAKKEHFGKIKPGDSYSAWLKTIVPEQRRIVTNALKKASKGEKTGLVVEHMASGSRRKYCSLGITPVKEKGRITSLMVVSRDLTEFKRYKESEYIFRQMIENSPVEVIITDSEGKIQYVNKGFETTTGWKKQECIGQTPRILKSGKHPLRFYKKLWHTIKTKKSHWFQK